MIIVDPTAKLHKKIIATAPPRQKASGETAINPPRNGQPVLSQTLDGLCRYLLR